MSADPYDLATIVVHLGNVAMHEVERGHLAEFLARVVDVESPVHWRDAARRIMAGAGVQKMGNRIEGAFQEAVRSGSSRRLFVCRGDFLWKNGMEAPPIRDRGALPNGSRKLELVAPEEIRGAILKTVRQSCGMNPDEVPTAVCRLFGFERVTEDMKAEVEPHVGTLIKTGQLKLNGQNVVTSG